jgi:hypothetical protein
MDFDYLNNCLGGKYVYVPVNKKDSEQHFSLNQMARSRVQMIGERCKIILIKSTIIKERSGNIRNSLSCSILGTDLTLHASLSPLIEKDEFGIVMFSNTPSGIYSTTIGTQQFFYFHSEEDAVMFKLKGLY